METTTETRRDLPCANPELVEQYIPIEDILNGYSTDFELNQYDCDCERVLCEHALNEKREDSSYEELREHFASGGKINIPVSWRAQWNELWEGHHRVVAALDAGFTHVPILKRRSGANSKDDWSDTEHEHSFY